MKTYADLIKTLDTFTGRVWVPVIYAAETHEWLPIDKTEWLRQLKMISNPEVKLPCLIELDDGDLFIHPKIKLIP